MSEKSIYDALRAAGMTKEGACGLMGNMMAESSMKANIVQRGGANKLTDEQYTAAADNGLIDFRNRQEGYGLCQWTYPSRREALLQFAKSQSASVGDEAMQVQFCIKEMREDYPGVWRVLTTSHDLYECARIVCIQYERPAVNNVDARYRFAQGFYDEFANGEIKPMPEPAPDPQPDPQAKVSAAIVLIQTAMQLEGYWDGPIDGLMTPEFLAAFKEYAGDVLGKKIP